MSAGDVTTAIRTDVLTHNNRDTTNTTEQGWCLTWLQYAHRDVVLEVGRDIITKATAAITTAASDATYDLAATFASMILVRDETNNNYLNCKDPEQFKRDHDEDETAGTPADYTIEWNSTTSLFQLRLGPMPKTASQTIRYDFYSWPADITTSVDPLTTAWRNALFHGGVYYAGRFYQPDNATLLTSNKGEFEQAISRVKRYTARITPSRRVIPIITRKGDMEPFVKPYLPEV